MLGLYKDPKGESVITFVTSAQNEEVHPKATSDMENDLKRLHLRVAELEEFIKKHVSL